MSPGLLKHIVITTVISAASCFANAQGHWSATDQSSGGGRWQGAVDSAPLPSASAPSSPVRTGHWDGFGVKVPPQQDAVVLPPTTQPVSVQIKQQSFESQSGVGCPNCKETEVERLARLANDYAEMKSRSLVSQGVAQVMDVTYQRCDADNDNMLVPPTYYNPAFHADDGDGGADNRLHGYAGASEMEANDMPSYDDDDVNHREWMNYRIASQPGGMFYTKKNYGPNCKKVSDQPPIFCDGGRSHFNTLRTGQAYIDVFNATATPGRCHSSHFTTFDCSDLVSAVFIASGLRFYKTGPAAMPVTTATMLHFLHPGPNDCVEPAKFSGGKSLESGDIILFNSHHSLVIDSVGADPFGLRKMDPGTPCTQVNPDDFDIKVAQAGNFGGRMGPSRLRYKDLLTTNGAIDPAKVALKEFAIKACETYRANTTANATVSAHDGADDNGATVLRPVGLRDPKCYVHKPATHPDCKRPTGSRSSDACHQPWGAKMKGEECLRSCSFDDSADRSAR